MIPHVLSGWSGEAGFPLAAIASEVLKVGKHFLDAESLDALRRAREAVAGSAPGSLARRYLYVVLDKDDGRYDYLTYTAQPLFPIVTEDSPDRRRDRTVALLLADLSAFELAGLAGELEVLPGMRPSPELVAKRLRLALRAGGPAARRVGIPGDPGERGDPGDGAAAARGFASAVVAASTAEERQLLRLTLQPVATLHDEYLFLRVLQAFEATFAAQAERLRATIVSLDAGDPRAAAALLRRNTVELREAGALFSLVATMQVEAFREFRQFTEGASAIQSESYKAMESLCRPPDPDRLDGLPYTSVPRVREAVRAGQPTVGEAVAAAEGRMTADDARALAEAMTGYESVLRRWRRTHHGIAVRMLGDSAGTGYTVGTPYLRSVIDLPLFDQTGGRS